MENATNQKCFTGYGFYNEIVKLMFVSRKIKGFYKGAFTQDAGLALQIGSSYEAKF